MVPICFAAERVFAANARGTRILGQRGIRTHTETAGRAATAKDFEGTIVGLSERVRAWTAVQENDAGAQPVERVELERARRPCGCAFEQREAVRIVRARGESGAAERTRVYLRCLVDASAACRRDGALAVRIYAADAGARKISAEGRRRLRARWRGTAHAPRTALALLNALSVTRVAAGVERAD